MSPGVILTVGNSLMGDDGAGPLLAELISRTPAISWELVDGGSMPENELHRIRALGPARVLIVDAAEMGLPPGEVRFIDEDIVVGHTFASTHALPLTFLIELLLEFVPDVRLLGIQPSLVAFSFPLSPDVRRAVEGIHARLRDGAGLDVYQSLLPTEDA